MNYLILIAAFAIDAENNTSERLLYNHPGLVVDLGVGLWAQPLPMDYDGDGDPDLLVATNDKPYNGIYFFENPGGGNALPVFKPGVRIGDAVHNLTVSQLDSFTAVMSPGHTYPEFQQTALAHPQDLTIEPPAVEGRVRANQWYLLDYDGDGTLDVIVGLGLWGDYGWDNAHDADGNWKNGPLHGHVYVARNRGTDAEPDYAGFKQIIAGDKPVDVYGAPSPQFEDWDGDGDLDLICGSFLDRLTYFENVGTREKAEFGNGEILRIDGEKLRLDLQMLQVVAFDWDDDGDADLIVGEEDGRVDYLECLERAPTEMPVFAAPVYFQQEAQAVKFGALSTPAPADWDEDGDVDIIAGNTAGYLGFIENLGGDPIRWAPPVYLKADGETIRVQAGEKGSIQGPAEAKWGYTVPSVADWNHDGLLDIVVNSIWGKVEWFENVGEPGAPKLKSAQPVRVAWDGAPPKPEWNWWSPEPGTLATQWRTSPVVRDIDSDGLNDLVMLDHEGYLAWFQRTRADDDLLLKPGQRIFLDADGAPLRLNDGIAGKSGRRKLVMADWDGDGRLDLLVNSTSVDWLRNVADEPGVFRFQNMGPVDARVLAGHTTCPSIVDWNDDGIPDLLTGAEDGFFYYLENPRTKGE
ncbi:MAG: VCBS repeat-containing protein [Candidatus Hydrogenedentales bacterium]